MSGVTPADLAGHPFLRGMADGHLAVLARVCWVAPVRKGHQFFAEGDTARRFWLIRSGHVALDVHAPGGRQLIVETLDEGDLLYMPSALPGGCRICPIALCAPEMAQGTATTTTSSHMSGIAEATHNNQRSRK